jgi:DNA polymerase III subunit delta
MKQDFDAFLTDVGNDKGPALLLLFGDDLQVKSACKSLIDFLVPKDQREFNLERFDGRSAAWDQIESSLMTPPFLPGKKLVWVENAPYFFSRENKGELGEKIMQLWSDGKKDEACKLLLDLLALEGWNPEQWEQLEPHTTAAVSELLDAEGQENREAADALVAYGKSKGFELKQRRESDEHAILKLFDGGLPPWDFLLFTAAQVDRRTRLYKRFEENGAIFFLGLERDRYGKVSRDKLREFIDRQLRLSGKIVEPRARELILLRAGDELRTLQRELDKLMLYAGEQAAIHVRDVETIFADQTEGWIFDLIRLITARDATAALCQLARLVAQGDHPLKLLSTIAAEVRKLLSARQLIENDLRGRWKRGMSYNQFEQAVLNHGTTLLTRNPYADYLCFQRAETFSLKELLSFMRGIHDADLRLKSTGSNPQIVMERLILHMCIGTRRVKGAAARTTAI